MADPGTNGAGGIGPEAEYRARLAGGQFCIQRCQACGGHVFFPRMVCIHCGGGALDWVEASGAGIVYSTSVVHQRPERGPAYNVALIDLAEGPRLMSRVEGIAPDEVAIGMAVQAQIITQDGAPVVVFRPLGD